jgi:mRNA interferase HigB
MWAELKRTFGDKVDKVGKYTVFDVGGNKCRAITVIHFNRAKVYIREVLTHPQYDEEKWNILLASACNNRTAPMFR